MWTSIDVYQTEGSSDAATPPSSDAARAEAQSSGDVLLRIDRFPGVLWFNDQYVVPPVTEITEGLGTGVDMTSRYAAGLAVQVRADNGQGIREPCGGAVFAVDLGAPDPRIELAKVRAMTPGVREPSAIDNVIGDVRPIVGPTVRDGNTGNDPTLVTAGGPVWIDAENASLQGALVTIDESAPTITYVESYRILDPNGLPWVVDKYTYRYEARDYEHDVWVVNILGGETFVPDDVAGGIATGDAGDISDCRDLLASADGATSLSLPDLYELDLTQVTCGTIFLPVVGQASPTGLDMLPSLADDPCMGYQEPSRNGYCYGGQLGGDEWCRHEFGHSPLRSPRAFLYFLWDDLGSVGEPISHADPLDQGATNGCQSGTDWPCPGEEPWDRSAANDDAEGNSHPFHPLSPPHWEAEPCPVTTGANPVNHGGSTDGEDGTCDYAHATALVDVYYSATSRPLPPLVRDFVVDDLRGSGDPFFDFHSAYPEVR